VNVVADFRKRQSSQSNVHVILDRAYLKDSINPDIEPENCHARSQDYCSRPTYTIICLLLRLREL